MDVGQYLPGDETKKIVLVLLAFNLVETYFAFVNLSFLSSPMLNKIFFLSWWLSLIMIRLKHAELRNMSISSIGFSMRLQFITQLTSCFLVAISFKVANDMMRRYLILLW